MRQYANMSHMPVATRVRAATAADLVESARARFVRGERIDIASLADELGVSRATAYRWAGGNVDALTAKVIGHLAEATFARAVREARGRGWARIVDAEERGLRYTATYPPYRRFLEAEPDKALRLVASKDGAAHPTMVRLHEDLLAAEAREGHLRLPVPLHTMAYALVRVAESFLYADLITGEEPDIEQAMQVMRLLCRDPA